MEVDAGGGWLGGAGWVRRCEPAFPCRRPEAVSGCSASTPFAGAPTFHVKAGYAFTPRFGVEGGLTFSHPELRASVSNDAEAAPPITIAERVDQYSIDAGIIVMIHELALGQADIAVCRRRRGISASTARRADGRGSTGVSFMRVVASNTGSLARNGIHQRGWPAADARLYLMSGGIAFDDGPRPHGAVSGSIFVSF